MKSGFNDECSWTSRECIVPFLQMSLCNQPMRELSNPGASGSIFYLTNDDEFILKTVRNYIATYYKYLCTVRCKNSVLFQQEVLQIGSSIMHIDSP